MCQVEPLAGTGVQLDLAQFTTGATTRTLFKTKPYLIAVNVNSDAAHLRALMDWIVKDWDYQAKGRKPRLAGLAFESATSRQSEDPSVFKYGEKVGVEVIPWTYYSFVASDFGVELRRIVEEEKADYVWLRGATAQTAAIMKDVQRLGYKKSAKWISSIYSIEPGVVKLAGANTVAGLYGMNSQSALPSDKGWGIEMSKKLYKKYKRKGEMGQMYIMGNYIAMIAHESIKRALQDIADPSKLSGRKVIEKYFGLKNFDTGGIAPPTTINYPNPAMMSEVRMVKWQGDGTIVPITDWIDTPWILGNPDFKE